MWFFIYYVEHFKTRRTYNTLYIPRSFFIFITKIKAISRSFVMVIS